MSSVNEVWTQPWQVANCVDTGRSSSRLFAGSWSTAFRNSRWVHLSKPLAQVSTLYCKEPLSQTYSVVSSSPGTKTVSGVPSVGRVLNQQLWLRKKAKSIVKVKLISIIALHLNIPHCYWLRKCHQHKRKRKYCNSGERNWEGKEGTATGYLKIKDLEMLTDNRNNVRWYNKV